MIATPTGDPRGLVDRLVAACLSLLVGATAVYVAVRLIEAVWNVLVIIGIVALFVIVSITLLRRRTDGW